MASSRGEINLDLERKLLSKIDKNVLLCAVCHDRFNVPKILPCQHSFCEQCLKVWVQTNGGRLTCPTCKQTSTLPLGGVPGLTNNRFINDLLDVINEVDKELQTSTQCEGCLREAKFWCNDCSQFFCDECVKSHSVVRSLKGHQLITMEVYKAKEESPDFRTHRTSDRSSDRTILAGNVRSEQVRVNQGRNKGMRQMHKTAVKKGTRSSHAVKDTLSANTTHRAISATGYGYSCQPAFVAREAVSPVLVDINLYKFIKHTQGRRLVSIETDCDVTFHCAQTADTGMVTIQPNSHRTIPEQTQLARDQFVSLYDNLYQTIEKFDMHIPKGLDKTTGEAAVENTKRNFSNIYIKKEGVEHYAMYGDKESLRSARIHFLSCLCRV